MCRDSHLTLVLRRSLKSDGRHTGVRRLFVESRSVSEWVSSHWLGWNIATTLQSIVSRLQTTLQCRWDTIPIEVNCIPITSKLYSPIVNVYLQSMTLTVYVPVTTVSLVRLLRPPKVLRPLSLYLLLFFDDVLVTSLRSSLVPPSGSSFPEGRVPVVDFAYSNGL